MPLIIVQCLPLQMLMAAINPVFNCDMSGMMDVQID